MGKRNWLSLETILTVIMSEKVRATGIKWVQAKDAAKRPLNKELLSLKYPQWQGGGTEGTALTRCPLDTGLLPPLPICSITVHAKPKQRLRSAQCFFTADHRATLLCVSKRALQVACWVPAHASCATRDEL